MSTHTDGAVPSVRPGPIARRSASGPADAPGRTGRAGSDRVGGHPPAEQAAGHPADAPAADAAGPPRPREPNARPPSADGDEPGDDEPGRTPVEDSGAVWVQQEIARRIAAKGARDSGRHARPDLEPDDDADARPGPATAEPAFRMAGPAAQGGAEGNGTSAYAGWLNGAGATGAAADPRPSPSGTPDGPRSGTADGARVGTEDSPADGARIGTEDGPADGSRKGTEDGPKQWPPATGAAGLPRRVRGTAWSLDRRTLLGETGGELRESDGGLDSDTRPVPSMWTAAASRRSTVAGPPSGEFGGRVVTPADVEDYDDEEDDDEEDEDPRGSATEQTAVIWRAPGLDDEPDAGTEPSLPATGAVPLHPYTGARPRRFAGDTTDAPIDPEVEDEAAEDEDDGPDSRRVRIVLSERRAVAHSVRTVVDVQDPGTVGAVLRKTLVSNQLALALRVGGVALLVLGLLPALFAAFPAFGQISVAGLRLPWLLLGLLVYPFLLGLGWWYVRSAERVEQDFVEDVQDR